MRKRLSDGHVDAPLLIYVGRIGAEKKLHRLKKGIKILCDLFYLIKLSIYSIDSELHFPHQLPEHF